MEKLQLSTVMLQNSEQPVVYKLSDKGNQLQYEYQYSYFINYAISEDNGKESHKAVPCHERSYLPVQLFCHVLLPFPFIGPAYGLKLSTVSGDADVNTLSSGLICAVLSLLYFHCPHTLANLILTLV